MFGKIIGTGSYIPEKIVSNEDISSIVDTTEQWIEERTGIYNRHIMNEETTSDMAVYASKKAIENAKIDPMDIDMIVVSSVSSNLILPNTACYVQKEIGAENACCLDLNSACTGFIMAYNMIQSYINLGLVKTALIIGTEGLSKLVDWSDRGTCILFGDGAGAAIVQEDKNAKFDTVMFADGSGGKSLYMENDFATRTNPFLEQSSIKKDNYIEMDGQQVFRFAVKQVPDGINKLMEKMNITEENIDYLVLHQANERIIKSIAKRLKVDIKKVPINIENYGNMSSACIPILLDQLNRTGQINSGDKIIMAGFGAGLTWAATYLEY